MERASGIPWFSCYTRVASFTLHEKPRHWLPSLSSADGAAVVREESSHLPESTKLGSGSASAG